MAELVRGEVIDLESLTQKPPDVAHCCRTQPSRPLIRVGDPQPRLFIVPHGKVFGNNRSEARTDTQCLVETTLLDNSRVSVVVTCYL
jgi:hypothetical protein